MRQFFEILSIFDWVTPTVGFVEDIINDPHPLQPNSWTFFIPYGKSIESGYNARQIEKMLDQAGVKHWGSQITGGEFFFTVPKGHAAAAEYLLGNAGVPIGLGAGAPPPETEMNSAADFAVVGVVRVGPSLSARLIAAFVSKCFGRSRH